MMYGSKDLNLTFKQAKEESDLFQQQRISSGLLRYRSAPSTLLGDLCEEFIPHREPEPVFGRFMPEKQPVAVSNGQRSAQFMPTVDEEAVEVSNSATLQMLFQSPQQTQGFGAETCYPNSMGMETGEGKVGVGVGAGGSSLLRQSSSPAGFLAQLNSENGFSMMRGMGGGFRQGGGTNADSSAGTSGKFKVQLNFPSRQYSGHMSQISEIGSDGVGRSNPEDAGIGTNNGGYQGASWEDSMLLSDSFSGSKRTRDHLENGELRSHVSNLTHHLSLPANVSEMASMEKFLQFQDAVPCKVRAKRGCATHPRSIAERMRRTRISERMRKLQDLVPNMDKQTNTADMLDLAVEYIKDLQKKVKRLGDDRAGCTCSAKHKP